MCKSLQENTKMFYIPSLPSLAANAQAVPIMCWTLISVLYKDYLTWPSQHALFKYVGFITVQVQ